MKKFLQLLLVSVTLLISYNIAPGEMNAIDEAQSKMMCVHNRVFIEFQSSGHVWGTMWLDDAGAPIPCHSNNDAKSVPTVI